MRSVALVAAAAGVTQAVTIPIEAGLTGLTITPNEVQANVGDVLEFHFYPKTHNVAQGTWDEACVPIAEGGFFSGTIPVTSGESNITFSVVVNNTDPMVVYCAVGSHCKSGMYNVINPAGNLTYASYAALAANASTGVAPPDVFGGWLGTLNASEWATSSSSVASSTSTVTSLSSTLTTSTVTSTSSSKTSRSCRQRPTSTA